MSVLRHTSKLPRCYNNLKQLCFQKQSNSTAAVFGKFKLEHSIGRQGTFKIDNNIENLRNHIGLSLNNNQFYK